MGTETLSYVTGVVGGRKKTAPGMKKAEKEDAEQGI